MFCLTAVLRTDCKELCHFWIRSLTLQQAAGLALAIAVQFTKKANFQTRNWQHRWQEKTEVNTAC